MFVNSGLPRLVCVAGRKRAGKGTVASYLISRYGYQLVKLADPLKDMLRVFYKNWGVDDETIERLIEGDLKELPLPPSDMNGLPACLARVKMNGKSSRHAMQTLGTEWRDLISVDLWMDMAETRIRRVLDTGGNVVVDDMRFMHEVYRMQFLSATLVRVSNSRLPPPLDGHVSEQELAYSLFDVHLANDYGFSELNAQVDLFVERLMRRT